jgi:hypothetical protein
MPSDPHARARLLLDHDMIAAVSGDDRRWLDLHLSECADCARHADLSRRAVRALDSFAFDLDSAAALRVQETVRARTVQMAARGREFTFAAPLAILLTILGSIALWQPAAWLASRWGIPSPDWQIAFAILWLVPSLLLDVLLLLRPAFIANNEGGTV